MTDREIMQQVLEALEYDDYKKQVELIRVLRERLAQPYCDDCGGTDPECPLAQPDSPCKTGASCISGKCPQCEVQPEQEPVAWVTGWHDGHCVIRAANPSAILPIGIALYITPPRREWVGLTEEERSYYLQTASNIGWWKAAEIIEAKLKHKNTVRMRRATRAEKIVNPGVYWVEDKE